MWNMRRSPQPKPKRKTFSLRTLVLTVSLVCAYFGCWVLTERVGVMAVIDSVQPGVRLSQMPYSPGPFLVSTHEGSRYRRGGYSWSENRHDYFWFFGMTGEIPIPGRKVAERPRPFNVGRVRPAPPPSNPELDPHALQPVQSVLIDADTESNAPPSNEGIKALRALLVEDP